MKVLEMVETSVGDVIVELSGMDYEELKRVNRGLNVIQNLISDKMADMVLDEDAP